MNDMMKLTHGSLTTKIAWISSCLLAGGASTLFNESVGIAWMIWGCFGLSAAVGLDVVARARDRARIDELKKIAAGRIDRETLFATEENVANVAIAEAVTRILGPNPQPQKCAASRGIQERYLCDLNVELLVHQRLKGPKSPYEACTHVARLTNVSNFGFELTLDEPMPRQRLIMFVTTGEGGREMMLGEILWNGSKQDGSLVAGGRFLNVMTVDDNDTSLASQSQRQSIKGLVQNPVDVLP
jgi:hypothetical protein